jgi:hypothetical protein
MRGKAKGDQTNGRRVICPLFFQNMLCRESKARRFLLKLNQDTVQSFSWLKIAKRPTLWSPSILSKRQLVYVSSFFPCQKQKKYRCNATAKWHTTHASLRFEIHQALRHLHVNSSPVVIFFKYTKVKYQSCTVAAASALCDRSGG